MLYVDTTVHCYGPNGAATEESPPGAGWRTISISQKCWAAHNKDGTIASGNAINGLHCDGAPTGQYMASPHSRSLARLRCGPAGPAQPAVILAAASRPAPATLRFELEAEVHTLAGVRCGLTARSIAGALRVTSEKAGGWVTLGVSDLGTVATSLCLLTNTHGSRSKPMGPLDPLVAQVMAAT